MFQLPPPLREQGTSQAMWEQIVNEEMHQEEGADVFPTSRVNRDGGFRTELDVFPEPDDPWVNRPRRLPTAATVKTGFHRKFNQGDHAIEGHPKPYIFDE